MKKIVFVTLLTLFTAIYNFSHKEEVFVVLPSEYQLGVMDVVIRQAKYFLLDDSQAAYDLGMFYYWYDPMSDKHSRACEWLNKAIKVGYMPSGYGQQILKEDCRSHY